MECKVEDCERTNLKGPNWCEMHYERARRNDGDPTADGLAAYQAKRLAKRAVANATGEKTCSVCKTTKPLSEYYSRNDWYYKHCKACHKDMTDANRLQQRLDNPSEQKHRRAEEIGPCVFVGCGRVSRSTLNGGPAGWYCKAHYNQWHRTGEMWKLNTKRTSYINDRFRRCTTCRSIKPHEQFYLRTGGVGRQTECKTCKVYRNRFNAVLVKGKVGEAVAIFDEMPKELQDRLKHRLEEAA